MEQKISPKILVRVACFNHNLDSLLQNSGMNFSKANSFTRLDVGNIVQSSAYSLSQDPYVMNVRVNQDSPLIPCTSYNLLFMAISTSEETNQNLLKEFRAKTNLRLSNEYSGQLDPKYLDYFIEGFRRIILSRTPIISTSQKL